MENSKNQHNKHNPNSTDWNQSLVNLWEQYGHEHDLTPDLTVRDLDIFHQTGWRSEYS